MPKCFVTNEKDCPACGERMIRVTIDRMPYLKMGKEKYNCPKCGTVAYYDDKLGGKG